MTDRGSVHFWSLVHPRKKSTETVNKKKIDLDLTIDIEMPNWLGMLLSQRVNQLKARY